MSFDEADAIQAHYEDKHKDKKGFIERMEHKLHAKERRARYGHL